MPDAPWVQELPAYLLKIIGTGGENLCKIHKDIIM